MSTRLLTLLCFLFFSTFLSVSESKLSEPHAAAGSFNVSLIQKVGASCSYTVIISTSCSSSRYTRDQISIAFGDAYGNQIYAPRLDDPSTKTFEQCSSDTFEINGPCTYQICYVYLYRSGPDGWIPESVKIYSHGSKAVTFPYNTNVPESIWYGFNYCNSASGSDVLAIGLGRIVLTLLGFIVAGSTLLL
ncbi:Embryo-specific protein ATS3B [Hirschfeldia incana]|nr:Embryo-specific protein ATS3B [Hirschfeldia incana]